MLNSPNTFIFTFNSNGKRYHSDDLSDISSWCWSKCKVGDQNSDAPDLYKALPNANSLSLSIYTYILIYKQIRQLHLFGSFLDRLHGACYMVKIIKNSVYCYHSVYIRNEVQIHRVHWQRHLVSSKNQTAQNRTIWSSINRAISNIPTLFNKDRSFYTHWYRFHNTKPLIH